VDVQPPWTPADPVGEALHFLRMSGTFYTRSELTAPWGMAMPPMPRCLWFHVVTSGECTLQVAGDPVVLRAGDLALVPHGAGHLLRSGPGVITPSIEDIAPHIVDETYSVLRHGGGGARADMVCGAVQFDHPAARALIDLLPALLHVPASPLTDRMQGVLRLMAAEVEELRPGGEAVITRLADVLVIQAIRSWLDGAGAARTGWLGALHDPQIGRALALVHREPARDWTVASLAAQVPMSRSAFAARFTELVGEPAMQYVTRWRMHVALDRLQDGDATVAEVAGRLGYRSEAAFSRAFKRVVGTSPGSARRTPA
jgi:AraC-like DNA-binding protein